MPKDRNDSSTAKEFVSLPPDVLAPVAAEMFRQLKDQSSPVALIYAQFFAEKGDTFAEEVAQFLDKKHLKYQQYMIVGWVLPHWSREAVSKCVHQLMLLATKNSGAFDTDLRAIEILARHDLWEREWLHGWLEFKKASFARLTSLLHRIELDHFSE